MVLKVGDRWGVFTCPECGEELIIVDLNDENHDMELGCVNGHAWTVGKAVE